jgi:hypothetical protein
MASPFQYNPDKLPDSHFEQGCLDHLVVGNKPHPANVPGDFYVEDGCCTMCEVPFIEAPELFGAYDRPDRYMHCYVKRQPQTAHELDHMCSAIQCAELKCIRYRGTDRLLQQRLVEAGDGDICDGLPPDLQQRSEQIQSAWRHRTRPSPWARLARWWRGDRT